MIPNTATPIKCNYNASKQIHRKWHLNSLRLNASDHHPQDNTNIY
jgi:hypothetical protein